MVVYRVFFLKTDTFYIYEYYYSISYIDLFKLKKELWGGKLEGIGFHKKIYYMLVSNEQILHKY